jgi:hypothetical protein
LLFEQVTQYKISKIRLRARNWRAAKTQRRGGCGEFCEAAGAFAEGLMHVPQYNGVGPLWRAHHDRNPNFSPSRRTGDCCNRVVALSLTWGEAPVKAFLAACIAAIVLAAIGWIVLNRMQEPADRAFATPPYTRVGD